MKKSTLNEVAAQTTCSGEMVGCTCADKSQWYEVRTTIRGHVQRHIRTTCLPLAKSWKETMSVGIHRGERARIAKIKKPNAGRELRESTKGLRP